MKQTLALILTVLLLCTVLAPSVLAAEEPSNSTETGTSDIVTDSGNSADTDNSIDIATPSVASPAIDGIDPTGTGAMPDATDISVQITAPMLTVTPAAITLTSFDEPDRTDAVAFPVGTSQEELSNWFADSVAGFTGYDADGNPYNLISGTWSLESVDTVTAGMYYVSASPDLGTEYRLADGVSLPRQMCAVSIQVPGEPDINCCVSGRGFLRFPWVLSAKQQEQLDEFTVWLRQDGGEWTSLSDGFGFTSDDFQLSQRILVNGSTYDLKVTYPGGQTGVLSFQYDGELSILDYSGGDRDGGDVNGGGSGTGTQPAPTTPQPSSNSNGNDSQNSGSNTPAPGDSSSESHDTLKDSDSTPQKEQDFASGEPQPTPTATQTPNFSQNNENLNSNNTPIQVPASDKPANVTSTAPTPTAVPVFSDTSFFYEAEGSSSDPVNQAVPQTKDSTKEVLNPASNSNETQSALNSESQQPAVISESYSPTQTVISGLRLKDLCAGEENIVFGSGNLTVSIPSKLLLALDLSDTDTLTVTLTQPESNQIMLAVTASGQSVTELTGTVLRLRYMTRSKNTEITVQNEMGEQITDTTFDGELLRFTADSAGTFTIMELSNTQEPQKSVPPLLPVSGGLILAVGGITFFRRRRHVPQGIFWSTRPYDRRCKYREFWHS